MEFLDGAGEFSRDDRNIWRMLSICCTLRYPEPEFLNTLNYNLAESASTGYQFNCFDFLNEKNTLLKAF
jgi:hypothetical protein